MRLGVPRPITVDGEQFGFPGQTFEMDLRLAGVMFPLMSGAAVVASLKKRLLSRFGKVPKYNFYLFDGLGKTCRAIREGSTSWRALHLLYNHPFEDPRDVSDIFDNFLLASPNAQAVRNRRKIALAEICRSALALRKSKVRMFAIAAGSAQSELEAMKLLREQGVQMECLMIDKEQHACDYAVRMAGQLGLADQFRAERALAGDKTFWRLVREFQPDMVEMLGLLDYMDDCFAAKLIGKLRRLLPPGGTFLTCNVCPNPERHFLKHVIDWDMRYRTGNDLRELMLASGFEECGVRVMHEPLGIHALAICRESPGKYQN